MISNKKIVFTIIAIALLIILFYPNKKKPNLNGIWTIDKVIIEDKELRTTGTFIISDNNVTISGSNLIEKGIIKANIIFEEDSLNIKVIDSLHILPIEYINYNGNYKINISQELEGSGEKAVFVYHVNLISKNKTFILSRTENVKWKKRLQRGRF